MKVIIWDIETCFNIAAIFGLFEDRTSPSNILKERYVICVAWKELNEKKTHAVSVLDDMPRFLKDPNDDYYVVKRIHEVLSGADAIVAHYGDAFDIKMFNSRVIYHKLPPLPNLIQIDTYKLAKSKFKFNSNKLDYLGTYLGVGKKMSTTPGLWMKCLQGNQSAIKEMVKYNKQDVDLLEDVYKILAPYTPNKINRALISNTHVCPLCESSNLHKRGFTYTKTATWQRYNCTDCGHWSKGTLSGGLVR